MGTITNSNGELMLKRVFNNFWYVFNDNVIDPDMKEKVRLLKCLLIFGMSVTPIAVGFNIINRGLDTANAIGLSFIPQFILTWLLIGRVPFRIVSFFFNTTFFALLATASVFSGGVDSISTSFFMIFPILFLFFGNFRHAVYSILMIGVVYTLFMIYDDLIINVNVSEVSLRVNWWILLIANCAIFMFSEYLRIAVIRQERSTKNDLDNVLDHMGEGLLTVSKDFKVRLRNSYMTEFQDMLISQLKDDQPTGKIYKMNDDQPMDYSYLPIFKLLDGGEMEETLLRYVVEEHDQRIISCICRPLPQSDEDAQVIIKFRDITKIYEQDQRLLDQQAQLAEAAKMNSLGQLASGMAHEINNPLVGVIGFAQMLREQTFEDEKTTELIDKIVLGSKRIQVITNHIRDFCRGESLDVSIFSTVGSIVNESVKFVEQSLEQHNIELRMKNESEDHLILADVNRLRNVFINLLNNSIDALQKKKTKRVIKINIESDLETQHVVVSLEDNGCGISKDLIAKIFEPFYTTKALGQGTGLGLAVSYGILGEHEAGIEVSSKVDEFTKFEISFPIKETKKTQSKLNLESDDSKATILNRKPSMLVVDDDDLVLSYLLIILEPHFELSSTSDPRHALQLIEKESFDIILTDFRMPEVTGMEVLSKSLEVQPETPVLIITGETSDDDIRKLRELGAKAILRKPFKRKDELLEEIMNNMDRNR